MSDHDERDLSAAFEELRAPASTAHYASRAPGLDVPSARSPRWPQAVAGVVAVAVAVAGAGTFLALRNARQGGSPASSGAYPAARTGATMAFDSTAGVTVMYGGTDAAGRPLSDTWTWNGTAWTAAAVGPRPLVDVRMVDDPTAGGVLLLGTTLPATFHAGAPYPCVSGSGTSGGGSATGAAGAANPAISPAPSPSGATPPSVPSCPPVKPATEQTWLFTGHAWSLAATTSLDTAPTYASQLAFDPTTRQVVAVSSDFFGCGPLPMGAANSTGAAFACPMLGAPSGTNSSSSTGAMPTIRCAVADCSGSSIRTWTWSDGSWKVAPPTASPSGGITLLFADPATHHATLMNQSGTGLFGAAYPCPTPGSALGMACPAGGVAQVTTSTWTGSGWHRVSQVPNSEAQPSLAGASMAAVAGHVVVLTTSGETWTFAAGQWTKEMVAGQPRTRYGAAAAEGPSETLVLFGGAAGGFAMANSSGGSAGASTAASASVGSDTWVWNGTQWSQEGGRAPSPPPMPSCAAVTNGLIPPCVGPPTKVAPATAIGILPQATGGATPAR